MTEFNLASLLRPHTPEEFLDDYWQKNPLLVHHAEGGPAQLLQEIPFVQSLDALLNEWPDPVQAHLPDVADESSSVTVNTADAKKLFANRMGLLFNQAHRRSPLLTAALVAIQKDLGLPAMTQARCMIYATPDGKGTAAHFDQNVNFVVQLHGTKRWWLAPNTHVENPTERYTIGQPVDPELASYLESQGPTAMPSAMPEEGRKEYLLSPGSVLYVPRGFWHSTEARGDALALNFTYSQPTWVDLFTTALRSRLQLSPAWRELADGVSATTDLKRREIAEMTFDALLQDLVEDLPHWRAADILQATEG
jgi:50S ribosomal protein L16 3-hydroxylase